MVLDLAEQSAEGLEECVHPTPHGARLGVVPATGHLQGWQGWWRQGGGAGDLPLCRASLFRGCCLRSSVAWHLCCCHGNDGGANWLMSPPRLQIAIL